jgi:hypothetical protein
MEVPDDGVGDVSDDCCTDPLTGVNSTVEPHPDIFRVPIGDFEHLNDVTNIIKAFILTQYTLNNKNHQPINVPTAGAKAFLMDQI